MSGSIPAASAQDRGGVAQGLASFTGDTHNRLPTKRHKLARQQLLVVNHGAEGVFGHIRGAENRNDPVYVPRRRHIYGDDPPVGHRTADEINDQLSAYRRQIVDKSSFAANMFAGRFVR